MRANNSANDLDQEKVSSAKRVSENLYLRNGIYYAVLWAHGKQVWKSLRTEDVEIAKRKLSRVERDLTTRVSENLYIRNGIYYAVLRSCGKQVWKSLKTDDPRIAKQELTRTKRDLTIAGTPISRKLIPTFLEATTEFGEACKRDGMRPRYLGSVNDHLRVAGRSFLANMRISDIRTGHLQDYLRDRYRDTSGRTANLDLVHLRKLFRFAIQLRWRWDDPTVGIKCFHHTEREVPVPSWDEIAAVVNALRTLPIKGGGRAADFIEFLALSGLRLSEAQAVMWSDVDFEKQLLHVKHGKFDRPRVVDLFPALLDFLQRFKLAKKPSQTMLFPPKVGKGFDPRNALTLGCTGAKVRYFSFHGLRHAWATRLVEQGVDFATIAKWMGHKDGGILVAKRYGTHSRREHFQSIARTVNLTVAAQPAG